jgi:hypothetical protein
MTEFYLEKARQLKREGNSFAVIRTYLQNVGIAEDEIKSTFRMLDDEEIHELYQKQQLSKARNELIISSILFGIGISFNIYRFGTGESIDAFTLPIATSIFVTFLIKYKRISGKTYTAAQILRENRWTMRN